MTGKTNEWGREMEERKKRNLAQDDVAQADFLKGLFGGKLLKNKKSFEAAVLPEDDIHAGVEDELLGGEGTNFFAEGEPKAGDGKTFEVVYNKNKVRLSLDELIKNAQKGLDYDKVRAMRDAQRETLEQLSKMAEKGGVTVEEALSRYQEREREEEIRKYVSYLSQAGLSGQAAREIAEAFLTWQDAAKSREDEQRQKAREEVEELLNFFPDADLAAIPQEVLQEACRGKNLTACYMRLLLSEKEAQNKKMQIAQKSSGSLAAGQNADLEAQIFEKNFHI